MKRVSPPSGIASRIAAGIVPANPFSKRATLAHRSGVKLASVAVAGVALALSGALVAACGTKDQGAVVIAMQTDMKVATDISGVAVYIQDPQGRVLFATFAKAIPDGAGVNTVHLPATLAVGAQSGSTPQIRVRLVGFRTDPQNSDSAIPVVVNEALMTIPSNRIVSLPMGLAFVNQGTVVGPAVSFSGAVSPTGYSDTMLRTEAFDPIDSSKYKLADGTCPNLNDVLGDDGECAAVNEFVESDLPDYKEEDVFGGGKADGTGASCFDTEACSGHAKRIAFEPAKLSLSDKEVEIPLKDSSIDLSKSALIVVVERSSKVGFCPADNRAPCMVLLDSPDPARDTAFPKLAKYPYRYDAVAKSIVLKPRFAKRLAGKILGIFATDPTCGIKPRGIPRCDAFAAKGSKIVGGGLVDGGFLDVGLPDTSIPVSLDASADVGIPVDAGFVSDGGGLSDGGHGDSGAPDAAAHADAAAMQ